MALEPMDIASVPGDSCGYEVRDEVFGRGILLEGERWLRGVVLYKLSLQYPGTEARCWKHYEDFGFLVGWFTFDVGNDLLALVEAPVPGEQEKKPVSAVLNRLWLIPYQAHCSTNTLRKRASPTGGQRSSRRAS